MNLSQIKDRVKIEHVFLAILVIAIVVRFAFLDLKLFHHDEAIHAWFSYKLLTEGTYMYDPVYHGPFLYYVTSGMFALFGASDLVGRILPCIFGCAIIPLIYWIYRMGFLNGKVAAVAALFVAISPQMVYFSRFLRNDVFVIFFSLLLICALLAWMSKEKGRLGYAVLAGVSAALGLCCKENMPIIVIPFGIFFLYLIWSRKLILPKTWIRDAIIAVVVFFAIVFTFYTSFWQYPEMALLAGPMAIEHWLDMHGQQRLGGPATFYLGLFVLYELPILLLAIVGIVRFFIKPKKLAADVTSENEAEPENPTKPRFSFASLFARPPMPETINKEREFMRFAIYWLIIACITYAYIGEKVPWLSLHQILPMVFVAAFGLFAIQKHWRAVVLILSVIVLSLLMVHVTFTTSDIDGPIVQVQNSEELRVLMDEIDAADKVAIMDNKAWPFMWYYRGDAWDKITYYGALIPEAQVYSKDFDVIITHDTESYESLSGYEKRTQRHSYWFDATGTGNKDGGNFIWNWIEFYFTRDGASGSYNFTVFTR